MLQLPTETTKFHINHWNAILKKKAYQKWLHHALNIFDGNVSARNTEEIRDTRLEKIKIEFKSVSY
jgi:hypothetical protein